MSTSKTTSTAPAISSAMPVAPVYDQSLRPKPEAINREEIAKVIRLADDLLAGKSFHTKGLCFTKDDVAIRLCEHALFPSIIDNFSLNKAGAELAAKDLIIRCARQVAADALDISLCEIAL